MVDELGFLTYELDEFDLWIQICYAVVSVFMFYFDTILVCILVYTCFLFLTYEFKKVQRERGNSAKTYSHRYDQQGLSSKELWDNVEAVFDNLHKDNTCLWIMIYC